MDKEKENAIMAIEENKNNQQVTEEQDEKETQTTGSENTEDDTTEDEGSEGGSKGGIEETKSYTQKQLNQMMTREKRQGRNAALRELGIDPKDTKTISLLQSILKGTQNGQQAEGGNDQQLAEANKRALVAEIKAEAMKQNAQVNFVDDIVTLVMSKMQADEEADMSTLIGEFKTKYPAWFEKAITEEDKKASAGQRGTGSSAKGNSAKGGKGNEAESLGKRLAAQRKGHNSNKKSFWS